MGNNFPFIKKYEREYAANTFLIVTMTLKTQRLKR